MQPKKYITQRDLAHHLGISQVTVSRALARSPLVPKAVQTRVLNAAAELGYTPDPVLSSLNAYRRTKMPIERGQTLAWITGQNEHSSEPWFKGTLERAHYYGYNLKTFNPNQPHMNPKRMMGILYNQGVTGLIFAPRRGPHSQLNIHLDTFSAVAIGYTLEAPAIDRVITDHYSNLSLAYSKAYEAGYRRIGLACGSLGNQRVGGRELAALLYQQYLHPETLAIPPALYDDSYEGMNAVIPQWILKWKPDAILCSNIYIIDICHKMGLKIPEDIAIITLMINNKEGAKDYRSGINPLSDQAGIVAVDTVVNLLRSNQRGIPANRRTHMVEGSWVDGQTMMPKRSS